MKKISFLLAVILVSTTIFAANKGIPSEVLKAGKIKYDKASNTLVLEDGFRYSKSKGLVVFKTGKDLHILLKGNAEFKAALVFKDKIIVDSDGDYALSVTSNISGSAVQCAAMTVNKNAKVVLLSRNSQEGMYALSCPEITVNGGTLTAEVTTALFAVQTAKLNLNGSWLEKPKSGIIDTERQCICFGDSIPAKRVLIKPELKKK